jgi:sugar phosphate permease
LSCWYTRKELALRTAGFYSVLVLATAFSGLIAAGIFSGLERARGLEGWRWLFITEGAGSFIAALIAMVVMPDYRKSKTGSAGRLMSDEERELAQDRIARDQVSTSEADHSVFQGLKLAAKDYHTWIFVLMLHANHTAYGFNNFFPTIVKGFNLGSRTITLLLTAPPYPLGAVVSFLVAFSSERMGERGFHISVPMGVAMVGFIISVATLNVPARYFACFLYTSGCFSAAIVNLSSQFGNI